MPRIARAKAESGFYHVIAKGSGGQNLFECDEDYLAFLSYLSKNCEKLSVLVRAYCLMTNHVHLLLEDHDDRLSEVMKATITSYALRFNSRAGHIGHVFQQRLRASLSRMRAICSRRSATSTTTPRRPGFALRASIVGAASMSTRPASPRSRTPRSSSTCAAASTGFLTSAPSRRTAATGSPSVRASLRRRRARSRGRSLGKLPRQTSKPWGGRAAMRYSLT